MHEDPVHVIVNALTDKGCKPRKQGKEFKALCPAHEDKSPSLQVGDGDKGAVVFCQAGCSVDSVMAALDLPITALFSEALMKDEPRQTMLQDPAPNAEATYFYTDEHDAVLYRVERHKTPGGGKKFLQARPDHSQPGKWIYNMGDTRRVPYRLSSVLAAAKDEGRIFVVEGEKDVLALEVEGLVASCNPAGAGKFKREFAEYFQGAHVVLIPDNDKPGHEHMSEVLAHVGPVARSVSLLDLSKSWTDMPDKADVSDWFAAADEHNGSTLLELALDLKPLVENTPTIFSAKWLMKEHYDDVKMAVPGVLAEGVTLLVGAPKIGKSWMSLGTALAVAQGTPALGTIEVEQGDVLYLALEDTPRRLQRRLMVMIGETEGPEKLEFACTWPRLNAGGLDMLEDWLKDHPDARLVIIDTLAKIKGASTGDQGSMYGEDYAIISSVKALADQYAVSIALIHHQRKATAEDPLNTVAGSTGLTGAADATVVLTRARGSEAGFLYVTGRDVEESKSMLEFDSATGQWLYLGKAEDVQEKTDEANIIALLEASEGTPLGPKDVADALDMKEGTARWKLSAMVTEGKIARKKRGLYVAIDKDDNGPITTNLPPGVTIHATSQGPLPGIPGTTVAQGPIAVDEDDTDEAEALTDDEIKALLEGDGFGTADEDQE